MTAIEFMEKQLKKCQHNLCKECDRDPASDAACNLRRKCEYYEEAIEALRIADKLVRCKDCEHHSSNGLPDNRVWCRQIKIYLDADDYCSYGERRTDGNL